MHLEFPKTPLNSVKDFLKHYLMIVLSILTALGLEAWVQHAHQKQAATEASAQMDQELRSDLASIRRTLQKNAASMQKLDRLNGMVSDDLRNGASTAVINQHLRAHRGDFQMAIYTPDIPTNAWDVALANQSVTWIEPNRLRLYSAAYTNLHEMTAWQQHGLFVMLDLPDTLNLMTDLAQGRDIDPMAFLHADRQMRETLRETNANLASMEKDLQAAISDHPAPY